LNAARFTLLVALLAPGVAQAGTVGWRHSGQYRSAGCQFDTVEDALAAAFISSICTSTATPAGRRSPRPDAHERRGNNSGQIGWVTTDRGDLHLSCASVLDGCATDGAFDIEGTPRPSPADTTMWDQGAIEYVKVEICDDGIDNDCDTLVDLADADCT